MKRTRSSRGTPSASTRPAVFSSRRCACTYVASADEMRTVDAQPADVSPPATTPRPTARTSAQRGSDTGPDLTAIRGSARAPRLAGASSNVDAAPGGARRPRALEARVEVAREDVRRVAEHAEARVPRVEDVVDQREDGERLPDVDLGARVDDDVPRDLREAVGFVAAIILAAVRDHVDARPEAEPRDVGDGDLDHVQRDRRNARARRNADHTVGGVGVRNGALREGGLEPGVGQRVVQAPLDPRGLPDLLAPGEIGLDALPARLSHVGEVALV